MSLIQASSDEETCYRRRMRLVYCHDQWKPAPPWDDLNGERTKSWYDLTSANQYAFDSMDLVGKVNWVSCHRRKCSRGKVGRECSVKLLLVISLTDW